MSSDDVVSEENVLPRRVVPQELPPTVEDGDCGACVLAGIFDMSVEDAYDLMKEESSDPDNWKPSCFSRGDIKNALWLLEGYGKAERVTTDVPYWHHYRMNANCFGPHPVDNHGSWFRYVRMAIEAGYYGIAMVQMFGGSYYTDNGRYRVGDHWIAIVGTRKREEELLDDDGNRRGAKIHSEILISCSSTRTDDEEWIEVQEFLRERGGYNIMLTKPA